MNNDIDKTYGKELIELPKPVNVSTLIEKEEGFLIGKIVDGEWLGYDALCDRFVSLEQNLNSISIFKIKDYAVKMIDPEWDITLLYWNKSSFQIESSDET